MHQYFLYYLINNNLEQQMKTIFNKFISERLVTSKISVEKVVLTANTGADAIQKAPNSQPREKGALFFYIINVLFDGLNCLTHLIHIETYSIFTSTCLAHTHIFAKLLKFFMQRFIHTDIQIFDFFLHFGDT